MKHYAPLATLPLLLAACGNPADGVEEAVVSTAKPEPVEQPSPQPEDTALSPASDESRVYTIHSDSVIGFVGSNPLGPQPGRFEKFTGSISVSGDTLVPPSSIEFDMDSTETNSDRLTAHLKNEDFFDVPNHPTSTFVLASASPMEDGRTEIGGNLTLHGVTMHIAFPATVAISDAELALEAEFTIKRFDFEIMYTGSADRLIRNEVVLNLDIKAHPRERAGMQN